MSLPAIADFPHQNAADWQSVLDAIFPLGVPRRTYWTDAAQIISILNHIGSAPGIHHLFTGAGEQLELLRAAHTSSRHDAGALELHVKDAEVHISRVSYLAFERAPNPIEQGNPLWAYFRLETQPLHPTGKGNVDSTGFTEHVEMSFGLYNAPGTSQARVDTNKEVLDNPESSYEARQKAILDGADEFSLVKSYLRLLSGSLVIFPKSSPYSLANDRNRGLHARHTADEFSILIEQASLHGVQNLELAKSILLAH